MLEVFHFAAAIGFGVVIGAAAACLLLVHAVALIGDLLRWGRRIRRRWQR